jgi:hypothetical protein
LRVDEEDKAREFALFVADLKRAVLFAREAKHSSA